MDPIQSSMLYAGLVRNRIQLVLLRKCSVNEGRCSRVVFLVEVKALAFSGKKIGVLSRKRPIVNTLYQLSIAGFDYNN